MTESTARVVKYIGDGRYFVGIPARDLTQAEWDKHAAYIKSSPHGPELYVFPGTPAPVAPEPTEATDVAVDE